jgi:hypothetical protein
MDSSTACRCVSRFPKRGDGQDGIAAFEALRPESIKRSKGPYTFLHFFVTMLAL